MVVYVGPSGIIPPDPIQTIKARILEGLGRRVLWQRAKDESKTGVGQ